MTAWFLFNQVIHIAYLNTQGFFWRWQASNFSVLSSHPFPQNCSNPSEILPFPELDVNSANSVSSFPLLQDPGCANQALISKKLNDYRKVRWGPALMEQSWPCDGAEVVLLVHLQATGQPLSCHLLGTERVAMRPPVAEGCGGFSSGMEGRSKVGRGQGRWHAGSPRRRPLFSSSSYTAIALGPKLIPPQKALHLR